MPGGSTTALKLRLTKTLAKSARLPTEVQPRATEVCAARGLANYKWAAFYMPSLWQSR